MEIADLAVSADFLLYGAYGYTGALIAEAAVEQGLRPLLAGRQEEPLQALAQRLGLPFVALSLSDTPALEAALAGVPVVLHAAGPYSATAKPMVEACLKTKTHYLDITGEVEVFEWIAGQDARAQEAGVALLPGVGFDVVPTDCMGAYVAGKISNPTHLELAFEGASSVSRGTALTAIENLGKDGMVREDGALKPVSVAHATRFIDFGKGQRLVAAIPWGDLATAYRTTGIENVITYMSTPPRTYRMMRAAGQWKWLLKRNWVQRYLKKQVNKRVTGPDAELRETGKSVVWAMARNAMGDQAEARLVCMEAYQLTVQASLAATQRVLKGEVPAGYQTPAGAFGADFILGFEGSERIDL